jgi:AcrR family transcriptional regulator
MNYIHSMNDGSQEKRRSTRRRERTRTEILEAARQVFASRGYHEASIAEITALADVAVGTFYLYFRDKDEAFDTLLQEGLEAIREQITNAVDRIPPQRVLETTIQAIFQHAYEQSDLFRLALTGGGKFTQTFRAQAWLTEELTTILETQSNPSERLYYNLPLLAHFMTGMITQGIVWWFDHDTPDPQTMTTQLLLLLRQGLPAHVFTASSEG